MNKKPRAKAAVTPPLNSLDWISRFVVRLRQLRPGINVRLATKFALDTLADSHGMSPERAATEVADRDLPR